MNLSELKKEIEELELDQDYDFGVFQAIKMTVEAVDNDLNFYQPRDKQKLWKEIKELLNTRNQK